MQLIRIRVQRQRLPRQVVGFVDTAIIQQAPHHFQKPDRCLRCQSSDPEIAACQGPIPVACRLLVIGWRL